MHALKRGFHCIDFREIHCRPTQNFIPIGQELWKGYKSTEAP